jgi:hypothetical protein
LSDTQRRHLRRRWLIGVGLGVLFSLGLLAAAVSGTGNPHVKAVNWIIPGAPATQC